MAKTNVNTRELVKILPKEQQPVSGSTLNSGAANKNKRPLYPIDPLGTSKVQAGVKTSKPLPVVPVYISTSSPTQVSLNASGMTSTPQLHASIIPTLLQGQYVISTGTPYSGASLIKPNVIGGTASPEVRQALLNTNATTDAGTTLTIPKETSVTFVSPAQTSPVLRKKSLNLTISDSGIKRIANGVADSKLQSNRNAVSPLTSLSRLAVSPSFTHSSTSLNADANSGDSKFDPVIVNIRTLGTNDSINETKPLSKRGSDVEVVDLGSVKVAPTIMKRNHKLIPILSKNEKPQQASTSKSAAESNQAPPSKPTTGTRRNPRKQETSITKLPEGNICCCESCNCYGLESEFIHEGRYCSTNCYKLAEAKKERLKRKQEKVEMRRHARMAVAASKRMAKMEGEEDAKRKKDSPITHVITEKMLQFHSENVRKTPPSATNGPPVKREKKEIEVITLSPLKKPEVKKQPASEPEKKNEAEKTEKVITNEASEKGLKPTSESPTSPEADNKPTNNGSSTPPKKQEVDTSFHWNSYLKETKSKPALMKYFKDPAVPTGKTKFRVGHKLEGFDHQRPSNIVVLSVAEVIGHRLRLHIDGYSDIYDFWENSDSSNIFPVGTCEKLNKKLYPPKGYSMETFVWSEYLQKRKAVAAPKALFSSKPSKGISVNSLGFRVGMKLEALDRIHDMYCVATVNDVMGERFLVHFDGWDNLYDYWADPTSVFIRPVGWCERNSKELMPPPFSEYKNIKNFSWMKYLKETNSVAAPSRSFKPRSPVGFTPGVKLECVDVRCPQLIRVATVAAVKDHQIKIHYDGWNSDFDTWLDDDSPNIHPISYSAHSGHPLEPPVSVKDPMPSCGIRGCRGIGNIKGPRFSSHSVAQNCPYAVQNRHRTVELPDRYTGQLLGELNVIQSSSATPSPMPEVKEVKPEIKEKEIRAPVNFDPKVPSNEPKHTIQTRFRGKKRPIVDSAPIWESDVTNPKEMEQFYAKTEIKEEKDDIPDKMRCLVTTPAYDPDPDPRPPPPQWLVDHEAVLGKYPAITKAKMMTWDKASVMMFAKHITKSESSAQILLDQEIDGHALLSMRLSDFTNILNMKVGPAIKLFSALVVIHHR